MKTTGAFRILFSLVAGLLAQSGARAEDAPLLRYQFTSSQTNVYRVQIETRGESGKEALAGNLFVITAPLSNNQFRLTARGTLTPRRDPGSAPPMFYPGAPPRLTMPVSFQETAELRFDERGRVLRESGDCPLAVPLGQMLHAFLEAFPANAAAEWETTDSVCILDEPLCLGPAAGFLSAQPYGMPYGFGGYYPGRPGPALLPVSRHVSCKITAATPQTVTIHKQVGLDSLLQTGNEPRVSANAEGDWIFDRAAGVFTKITLEGKSVVATETVTRRTMVALRYQRLEGAELEVALKPPPTAAVPRKLSPEELQKALAYLKSADLGTRQAAAARLGNAEFDPAPPEVLTLMTALATDPDASLRQAAANVFASYGTKDQVPVLLKLLKDGDSSVRQSAMRGLGRLKDKRAAEPLVEIVAGGDMEAHQAVTALSAMGPEVENTVLRLLKEKHIETRRQACNILRQVGTRKSIEPLKEAMVDPDQMLSQAAAEAVRAIQSRAGTDPAPPPRPRTRLDP